MKKFYVTFMQKQRALSKCYIEILASDENTVREEMNYMFKDQWGFVYGEDKFDDAIKQFGLIKLMSIKCEHGQSLLLTPTEIN